MNYSNFMNDAYQFVRFAANNKAAMFCNMAAYSNTLYLYII